MITCHDIQEQTPSYLDGDLPLGGRASIALHLMMCALCRGYVRQIGSIRAMLGSLPRISPAEPAREAARNRFHHPA